MQYIKNSPATLLTKENCKEVLSSFGLNEHGGSLFMSSGNNFQSNYEIRDDEFYIRIRSLVSTVGCYLRDTTISELACYYDCCGGYVVGEEWYGEYIIHLSYRHYNEHELSDILSLRKKPGRKNLVSKRKSEDIAAWSNRLEEWW